MLRRTLHLLWIGAALLVILQAALLIVQPDSRDALRRADALFADGHYYTALQVYRALPPDPRVYARIGMLETIRAEYPQAARSFGRAINGGVAGAEYDLVRLGQGYVAAAGGSSDEAAQFWNLIPPESPFAGLVAALSAGWRLQIRDYGGAEWFYRSALELGLPESWRRAVQLRLALLRASSDPAVAQQELAARAPQPTMPDAYAIGFALPLLRDDPHQAEQLAAALQSAPQQRDVLLGRIYLDAGMPELALARFAAATNAPLAVAYARWRMGDQPGSLADLAALAHTGTTDSEVLALRIIMHLARGDIAAAQQLLQQAPANTAADPELALARAQFAMLRGDYLAAGAEYQAALEQAPPERRARYALAQARFQAIVGIQACTLGRAAAAEAIQLTPNDPRAWNAFAAILLICREETAAVAAAEQALRLDPSSAEAAYQLGRAYMLQGDTARARAALIRAADLDPASPWRARAEQQLQSLQMRDR